MAGEILALLNHCVDLKKELLKTQAERDSLIAELRKKEDIIFALDDEVADLKHKIALF